MVQFLSTRHPSNDEFDEFFEVMKKCLWVYDQQRSIKPNTIIPLCRYAVEKLGVKHILIDSLMKCGISPEDYGAQKQFVDRLQNIAHISDVHIHLVAHARKGKDDHAIGSLHDIKGTSEIADMAENVVFVWRNKNKELHPGDESKSKEPDAIIKVEAQRNGDGWIGEVNLNYDKFSMKFKDWKDGI
jgi:twinkle protein